MSKDVPGDVALEVRFFLHFVRPFQSGVVVPKTEVNVNVGEKYSGGDVKVELGGCGKFSGPLARVD